MKSTLILCPLVLALCSINAAHAYDGPVQKQVFSLPSYATVNGQAIRNLRMGYETYGTLNAARDNVILLNHFITGTSHAAGKYTPADATAGYWDSIIGAGKPIDTDRYFVVATDSLVNPSPKLAHVVTTGPASLNPETGKPYGLSFPVVAARDTVEVQKALLDSLGISRLHAVAGASAGAWLSVEWASAYPERVQRLLSIVGPGVDSPAYAIAKMSAWGAAVTLDPKWAQGDYYGKEEPVEGLKQAIRQVTFDALSFAWADKAFGQKWADPSRNPATAFQHQFAVDATLARIGEARAREMDANNWLYTLKSLQLSTVQPARIKAPSLFVGISSDLIFPPALSRRAVDTLKAQGTPAEFLELNLPGGHADALGGAVGAAGPAIREFLAR
jgi:homoserine O-acetyltransferase